ncbi:MAG: c-type cytochrome biogenesis protein CcsB, partial [Actinomycetes bacterium]
MTDAALAALSNNLVYATLVVLTLALMAFAADLAVGAGRVRASTAKARSTVSVAAGGSSGDDPGVNEAADSRGSDHDSYGRIGVALTALGFGLLLGAVVTRGLAVGRPPWGNMYEFSLAGALSALGVF